MTNRVGASKYRLAEWIMYALLLWSLKAAMAVFYMRLTVSTASRKPPGTPASCLLPQPGRVR